MTGDNSSQDLQAVIVGSSRDAFVQNAIGLLKDYGVGFVFCEDIYWAVAELVKRAVGGCLVIGRLGILNAENGRFIEKARENGYRLCCFVQGGSAAKYTEILGVMRNGGRVVNEPEKLAEVIDELLSGYGVSSMEARKSSAFDEGDFAPTRAELDALLEV